MQIGLIGYGTIGSGIDRLIRKKFKNIQIKKILVKNYKDRDRLLFTTNKDDILNDRDIDVVIIAMGGVEAAYQLASEALSKKKHVISCNKDIVSHHLPELLKLANDNGVKFKFESTVGAGLPWIRTLIDCAKINDISKVYGNFNGTSNFILDMMKRDGIDFDEALLKSRILCYQEPDYKDDISGVDSRNKLAISIMLAFNKYLDVESIPTYGIENIRSLDFGFFERHNLTPKLMSFAIKNQGKISAMVAPTLYDSDSLRANVYGNNNMLGFVGDEIGEMAIIGEGAGKYSASNGVMLDLNDIIENRDFYNANLEETTLYETLLTYRFYFSFDQSSYKTERVLLPYVHSIYETQDSFVLTTRNISLDTCIDLLEKIEDTDERFFFAVYDDGDLK